MSLRNKQHIERQELARKYIRGKLSEQEAEEFEIHLLDKPEMIEELELDEAFYNCLPEAEERLVEKPSIWKWVTQTPVGASIATFACTGVISSILFFATFTTEIAPQGLATGNVLFLETVRSNNQVIQRINLQPHSRYLSLFIQIEVNQEKPKFYVLSEVNNNTEAVIRGQIKGVDNDEFLILLPVEKLESATYKVTLKDKNGNDISNTSFGVEKGNR